MLQGQKTYIVALVFAAVAFAQQMGYITKELGESLLLALGALGAGTLAAKVNRVEKKLLVPIFLLIGLGSFSSIANAQAVATDKLVWNQPAPDLATAQAYTYAYYPDAATTAVVLTSVTCASEGTPVAIVCRTAFPAFTPGAHTLTIVARNVAGESAKSTVLSFTFVVVPQAPVQPRIEK